MTGLVRKATLLTAAGLLVASAAMAGVPSEGNSTKPGYIQLGGSIPSFTAGTPDPVGLFIVVVRDLANNPLNGASVVIDFSNCDDVIICEDQFDVDALVNCAAKTVRKFTDITGSVQFNIIGGSTGAGAASSFLNHGRIYANGTLIGSPSVAVYDLDNASGVGANDLSAWFTDFGTGNSYGRSDYDGSGSVGANDLSLWFTVFGSGASSSSCASSCP